MTDYVGLYDGNGDLIESIPIDSNGDPMNTLTMYGASDDLVEFEGAVVDEFYLDRDDAWDGIITAPNGEQLQVHAHYGSREWELSVSNVPETNAPEWPIRFGERPDREGDPAIVFEVPEGTTVTPLTEPDSE